MEQIKDQLSNKLNEVLEQQTVRQFVMYCVTAFAIVIGTVQFVIRTWKENDMSTRLRSFILKTLAVIDKISAGLRGVLEENSSLV
jgi:Tfp pilus assembly pilus retraction ATPase PilT